MCVVVQSLNHAGIFVTPQTVAHQAPLSVGFPGKEYWSGLPCSPPGGLPKPGGESHISRIADELFTAEPLGKPSPLLMATKHEFNSLRMKLCPLQSSSLPSVTLCPFPPHMHLCQNLFMPPSCDAMVFAGQSRKILQRVKVRTLFFQEGHLFTPSPRI